ncbi:hypothetical protein VIMY103929_11905 [Vibrio mytili]
MKHYAVNTRACADRIVVATIRMMADKHTSGSKHKINP